ncbi:MAG: hypothetical protein ABGX31_02670 [bacterium]
MRRQHYGRTWSQGDRSEKDRSMLRVREELCCTIGVRWSGFAPNSPPPDKGTGASIG